MAIPGDILTIADLIADLQTHAKYVGLDSPVRIFHEDDELARDIYWVRRLFVGADASGADVVYIETGDSPEQRKSQREMLEKLTVVQRP